MTETETGFPLHDIETAPPAARPLLEASKAAYGMVPNLHAALAESPAALKGYATLWDLFETTGLTPAERQVVYLASNFENACRYCMAGHTVRARRDGVPEEAIEALRAGRPIQDERLEALRRFAAAMVVERGHVGAEAVEAFLAAGFTRANVLDVILGLATKVISNYANHVVQTPLDGFMSKTAWEPPSLRGPA